MLRSVVLELVALEASRARATHGHQAHALFMDLIRQADPARAQQLHDLNGEKPFTVSPLLELSRPGGHEHQLAQGQLYTIRFTLLSDELFGPLIGRFLKPGSGAALALGAASLGVRSIDSSTQGTGWAAAIDEAALVAGAKPSHEIRLQFATPTAFSRGEQPWGRSMDLLPGPTNVFDSLARRWNGLVARPKGLEQVDRRELSRFVAERVVVSRLEGINTRALRFGHGLQIGFSGTVGYTVLGVRGPKADEDGLRLARTLDWLADFAFYSGVGTKTTMGMGQVRRIRPSPALLQAIPNGCSIPEERRSESPA